MTFDNFRYFLKFRNHIFIHRAFFKFYPDICASPISKSFGIDVVSRTYNYTHINHSLYSLMNSSPRDATFYRYIFRWYTRIAHNDFKYLSIKVINFFHY